MAWGFLKIVRVRVESKERKLEERKVVARGGVWRGIGSCPVGGFSGQWRAS